MIPVLITPVVNRYDLLDRLIDSIDHQVGRLMVIDNGQSPYLIVDTDSADRTVVFSPPFEPLGYGGGINFGIIQNPDAPWWMWSSNDVVFEPGHLDTVVDRMEKATGPQIVTGGFTWGAVNRELIEVVGLIDEWSFFPIYFDDNDYHYRCQVAGVEWIEDWSTGSRHGDGIHGASLAIRSDLKAEQANNRSFMENGSAYIEKWGGPVGHERFTSPWDSGMPIWVTRPDIPGRVRRRW